MTIHDINGRLIYCRKIEESTIIEDVRDYSKGIYMLSVEKNSQMFLIK